MRALDGVSLDVREGEVHALAGENGAGKSTLVKILAGLEAPDGGEILWRGRPVRFDGPFDALRAGISIIHQELLPFPDLTVAENIAMGREPVRRFGWIDRAAMNREASRLLEKLNAPIPPARRMGDLTIAEMQTVEIAKALGHRSELLIMDEPTSAISEREVEALTGVIAGLQSRGVAVIYISHRMSEVFRIAGRVTVLRDGRRVSASDIAQVTPEDLVALMVGRTPAAAAAQDRPEEPSAGAVLEVRNLSRPRAFREISFTLRRGEILGIAGLMGTGRTALAEAVFGLSPAGAGEILLNGRPVAMENPAQALQHGIALVTEDRKRFGLVPGMSVAENLTLAALGRFCRGPWVRRGAATRAAAEQIEALSIRPRDPFQSAGRLSGGNQQKIVIGKALLTSPTVLILDEPTRGIDVGAKAEIHAIIRGLAREGKAILLISSELPELLALSHRILVMREGTIAAEFAGRAASAGEILKFAMPA